MLEIFNFNLKILEQSFLISVENYKNYTLLDALFILVQTFDVKIVFQRNIAITNSEFEFLELNCSLNDIRDREELIITSATSGPQIEFIAKLISEDKKFAFNQDTKVKDLIYILSLYYEIDYRRFRASTPINTIDNLELTIIENGIYSDSLLILDILKTGGGKNYSKVKFLNVQTGTIANNQNSGAPQWRTIKKGLSWLSNCKNSSCPAYKDNPVVICEGFGVFDLNRFMTDVQCPICKQSTKPLSLGFYLTKYNFDAITETNKKIHHTETFQDKLFHYFPESNGTLNLLYGSIETFAL